MDAGIMVISFGLLLVLAIGFSVKLFVRKTRLDAEVETLRSERDRLNAGLAEASHEIESLAKYRHIVDVEREVLAVREALYREQQAVQQGLSDQAAAAQQEAQAVRDAAYREQQTIRQESAVQIAAAQHEAVSIVSNANQRAEAIAGDALGAREKVEVYRREAQALKNAIEGYGDQYVVPTHSVLDDLAEGFGFTEAGEKLKVARQNIRQMVKDGRAAMCDYVEANRRDTAIAFVVDAFNGKVDTILSGVKADNVGTLRQKIEDLHAREPQRTCVPRRSYHRGVSGRTPGGIALGGGRPGAP